MVRAAVTYWFRFAAHWLLATAGIGALTLLLVLLHADAASAGILYLVIVVWAATLARHAISIYLAVLTSLSFDFFFLQPLHTFALAGTQAWLAMSAFVAACAIVSRVAEQARKQTTQAERRREDAERLYELSQEIMLHEDAAGLVREIPRLVANNFALESVLLYVREDDQMYSSVPVRAEDTAEDLSGLQEVLRAAVGAAEGPLPLPQGYVSSNLVFGMSSVGSLAWKPDQISREVAALIAAQVAIAITRAHALESSSRLEAARAADRLRSALIDSLTHELRTPLTAIRAAAATLMESHGLDDGTRSELAAIVEEESDRLDALIGEAMEIAEIEADGIQVRLEPTLTGAFLEQAAEQTRDQLGARRLTVEVEQPDKPVWFDPHVLGRVMRHLLENAARYTPATSRIVLRSRRRSGKLEFAVADDGPGIDSRDLPHIFEKFYRGRSANAAAKGSGMGLAIVRALLLAHDGSIEAESTPGAGTTFRFCVPLVDRPPGTDAKRRE